MLFTQFNTVFVAAVLLLLLQYSTGEETTTGGDGGSACPAATTFILTGSTIRADNGEKIYGFELCEIKLFTTDGTDVARDASTEFLLQPKNPDQIDVITDGETFRESDRKVFWEDDPPFQGQDLVQLTFTTPQQIIGVELYTTNYESFGTDCTVLAVTYSDQSDSYTVDRTLPLRIVYDAHLDQGVPEAHCYENGIEYAEGTCSTMDGADPPFGVCGDSGDHSFVGGQGGDPATNTAEGNTAFVGAGDNNKAKGDGACIVAGYDNTATGPDSFVGAGQTNTAGGGWSAVVAGESNSADGQSSFVGSGDSNQAMGDFASIPGGAHNVASGKASVCMGGEANTASGNYAIAMGFKADANKDRSLVINLGKKGKQVSSNNKGEFLVNSDSFTIQIGKKEVTIDKKNIKTFEKLLKNGGRRYLAAQQPHIDEQQSIIKELQQQNEEQQGQIKKQQEQINELYRIMTARTTEN
mmetsp:Transcript_35122/g.40083  ORF Transcript_35122/g.40083 Transcript_35122/m.40083 type:complete len:468 (+) Transcript_35122:87-1490(+)